MTSKKTHSVEEFEGFLRRLIEAHAATTAGKEPEESALKVRQEPPPVGLTTEAIATMSDQEVLARVAREARESLVKFGTAIPPAPTAPTPRKPRGAAAARVNPIGGKDPSKTDWTKVRKMCPQCGKSKFVEPDFGVRPVRDTFRAQSWCRNCRATTNYHARPRRNS
jgi:hypothetical protein